MIQDIFPHKMHNQYIPGKKISLQSTVFCFKKKHILASVNGGYVYFPAFNDIDNKDENYCYLFSVDNQDYFLYMNETDEYGEYKYIAVSELKSKIINDKVLIFALYTAWHLADWYGNNKFCGRCGAKTTLAYNERQIFCQECKREIYPSIMPAVIVAVTFGDMLLMTKYAVGYPHYALVAGFTEIGETVEKTVEREVMEETGIKVKNIRYYKSQPWGIASDLLLGFFCDADNCTDIIIDKNELSDAKWVKREDIAPLSDKLSLTNDMISLFKSGNIPM